MSVSFHINPRARWHDGAPVSAEDVRYTFQLVKDTSLASPLASNLDNVDSVSVVDSLTARVWFHQRTPDAFFKAATPVAILPSHLLKKTSPASLRESAFARSPVGSGRFRFAAWDRGARIVLQADSANYRGRPNADRVIWLVSADYPAAALRFLGGSADFLDVVKPELVSQVKAKGADVVVSPGSLDYGYVAFNLRNASNSGPHPIFGDRETRRALVMAVDRSALVRSVFDTLGLVAHGPATRILATSDTTIGLPYDPEQASRTLDSLGWRRGADGMRSRGKTPLAFSLMVPSSSAIRMKVAVLLQEQWRKAGANVRIEPLEMNTFGSADGLQKVRIAAQRLAHRSDPVVGERRVGELGNQERRLQRDFVSESRLRRRDRQRRQGNESGAERGTLPAGLSHPHGRCTRHVALRAAQRQRSLKADSAERHETRRVVGQSRGLERRRLVGLKPAALAPARLL